MSDKEVNSPIASSEQTEDTTKKKEPQKMKISRKACLGIFAFSFAVLAVSTLFFPRGEGVQPTLDQEQIREQSGPEEGSLLEEENRVQSGPLATYGISVPGEYLVRAVAMTQGENVWSGVPAYVFIGEKKELGSVMKEVLDERKRPPEDHDGNEHTSEELILGDEDTPPTMTFYAISELMDAAREVSKGWDLSDKEREDFLNGCQCVQTEKYVIIANGDKYHPVVVEFNKAVNDPEVLDFEDLMNRLLEVELEEESEEK